MDLLDILFELLGLAIALIGKFWVVILAGLSYLLFGKKKEPKRRSPTIRPVLTPVANGGYPTPSRKEEPDFSVETPNPFSRSVEYVESESVGEHSLFPNDVAKSEDYTNSEQHKGLDSEHHDDHFQPQQHAINPREAMKWSIIFSPPRSKMPHSPIHRR